MAYQNYGGNTPSTYNKPSAPVANSAKDVTENELIEYGKGISETLQNLPRDYDVVNSVRGLYLMCVQAKGGSLLNKCTKESVEQAVRTMISLQLNPLKNQCYPIAYGNSLKVQPSYQGNMRSVYASNPNVLRGSIRAQIIRQNDIYAEEITQDGRTIVAQHTPSPINDRSNAKNPIIAAYAVAMVKIYTGKYEPFVISMTMDDIKTAWSQGSSAGAVAQKFTEEMAKKTVVNRLCKWLRDSTDEGAVAFDEAYDEDEYDEVQDDVGNEQSYDIDIDDSEPEQGENDTQEVEELTQNSDKEQAEEQYDPLNCDDEDFEPNYDDDGVAVEEAVQEPIIAQQPQNTKREEAIEVQYGYYKDHQDMYQMVPQSYNPATKTVLVHLRK